MPRFEVKETRSQDTGSQPQLVTAEPQTQLQEERDRVCSH